MNLPKSKYFVFGKKQILIGAISVSFIISFLTIANHFNFFVIKKVECYTQFGNCPDTYLSKLDNLIHQPIFSSDTRKITSSLLSSFSEIDKFDIYRRIPSVLVISVRLKSPIGVVSSKVLGAKSLMIDDSGKAYLSIENSSLPALIISDPIIEGDTLPALQTAALKIITKVSLMTEKRVYGQLQNNMLNIKLGNDTEIIIDVTNSANWESSLHLLLSRSKITGNTMRKIDLRFNNPIITY